MAEAHRRPEPASGLGFFLSALFAAMSRGERLAWLGIFLSALLVAGVSALSGFWIRCYLTYFSLFPLSLALLTSIFAVWRAHLVRQEQEEAEERERLRREYDRGDLFDDQDAALRMAESARRQFDRWIVPIATFLLGAALIWIAALMFLSLTRMLDPRLAGALAAKLAARTPVEAGGLALLLLVLGLLLGAFLNGESRAPGCRWLRPVAQWLLAGSFASLVTALAMLVEFASTHSADFRSTAKWDVYLTAAFLVAMAAFGVELLVNFVIEFFRPRSRAAESQPLYESRLLALVTEPGGIAHNVAHALDYQFGFKVSETWFYRFLERAVVPFLALLAVTFYLLNCFVLIKPEQLGVKLRFGQAVGEAAGPGLKLKWPWPIESYRLFPVGRTQQLVIGIEEYQKGEQPGPGAEGMRGDPTGRIILWDKHHYKSEISYLTAVPTEAGAAQAQPAAPAPAIPAPATPAAPVADETVPVNLLAAHLVLYYRIRPDQVRQFAFNYRDAEQALVELTKREAVSYLAAADLSEIIGPRHQEAQLALESRIRAAVTALANDPRRALGLEIVHLAMPGVHPPVEVADAFQNVIIAEEERHRIVLDAQRDAVVAKLQAKGAAAEELARAESYKYAQQTVPASQVTRFQAQLANYRQAPAVFIMREYLEQWRAANDNDKLRKFIIVTPEARRISEFIFREALPGVRDLDTENAGK